MLMLRSSTDSRGDRVFCFHACGRLLGVERAASTARSRACASSPLRSSALESSGRLLSRNAIELVTYMKTNSGRKKMAVLFGTNYQMIFHHNALADLDQLNLDQETPRALPRRERTPHLQHLSPLLLSARGSAQAQDGVQFFTRSESASSSAGCQTDCAPPHASPANRSRAPPSGWFCRSLMPTRSGAAAAQMRRTGPGMR
jgi:hypothetical protein